MLLIALAWALMTAGLTILPGLWAHVLDEPWTIVASWVVVSFAWIPAEVVMRPRLGAFARFCIQAPLWVAAALCAFWLRNELGMP